ncbi:dUTP diphosphatase [Robertmurraya sp. Marseille-Q9965]
MQLQEIFAMQKELDSHIEQKHGLQEEDLFDRKILALLVELGELANETRCFKFWSLKPASDQATILEEFVDGVHFMASLGIECSFDTIEEVKSEKDDKVTINEQFLNVYEAVHAFRIARSKETYILMLQAYLFLANLLGFQDEDIKRAYISKNEVNYKRQQTGY